MKAPDSEAQIIRRLSRSPYLLVVADSILENIDREALAELLASYLYLESKGRANLTNFMSYVVTRRLRECVAIAASATPALLAGLLVDEELRSIVLSSLGSLMTRRPAQDGVENET